MGFLGSLLTNVLVGLGRGFIESFFKHLEEKQKRADYIKYGAAEARKKGLENVIRKAERTKNALTNRSDDPFKRMRRNNDRIRS